MNNNNNKQKLVALLGKEELSWSDLEDMLPLFGKLIGEISDMNFFRTNGVGEVKESLEEMLLAMNGLGSSLVQVTDKLHDEIEVWWAEGDKKYCDFYEKNRKLKEKFESVPAIKLPDIQIPYSFEKAIEIADKLASMDDKSRDILLKLYGIQNDQT